MRPLAGLLAVVSTVATPAVLAACLTLCAPGMRHAMAAPASVDAAAQPTDAVACPDHAAAAPDAPLGRVSAADVACCDDVLEASAPSVTAERACSQLRLSGVVAPIETWSVVPSVARPVRIAPDRGSPPPPLRRPSVLRI